MKLPYTSMENFLHEPCAKGNIILRPKFPMIPLTSLLLGFVMCWITHSLSGCDAGIADIPGLPDCVDVDMTSSNNVCYPMTANISQQQFTCQAGSSINSNNALQCRQNCTQTDPLTNITVSFYSDCTYSNVSNCTDRSLQLLNPDCTLNGLQAGLIIAGCTLDPKSSPDGIFCKVTLCDMNKSLLDVYEQCTMCRWVTVYADSCYSADSGGSFKCTNVAEDKQDSSRYGCRAIACSTFGTNGIMTLNTSTTSNCWQADWYNQLGQ